MAFVRLCASSVRRVATGAVRRHAAGRRAACPTSDHDRLDKISLKKALPESAAHSFDRRAVCWASTLDFLLSFRERTRLQHLARWPPT